MESDFNKHLRFVMGFQGVERIFGLLKFRLPVVEAALLAKWVVEDMESINFIINIHIPPYAEELFYRGFPFPIEYVLSSKDWSINSTRYRSAMEGTHLTRGDLFYLAKVCKIVRDLPDIGWPNAFDRKLNNPSGHISALTEIWWLGRFVMPRNVIPNHQIVGSKGDVDWRFECGPIGCPVVVNLEVKRRPGDLANIFDSADASLFEKIAKKFPDKQHGNWVQKELNIVAITIYSEIDRRLTEAVQTWLTAHKSIDMFVLFSFKCNKEIPWRTVPAKYEDVFGALCMKEPDEDDLSSITVLTHLDYDRADELGLPCERPNQS